MDDQPGPLYVPPAARRAPAADREPALPGDRPQRVEDRPIPGRFAPGEHLPPPPPPRSRARRIIGWLLILLVVAGVIAWVVLRSGSHAPPTSRFQSGGPMPVGTAAVVKGDMPVILTGLGAVTPLANVTVKTQINGQLTEVAFQEGQIVKKGDVLAQIDPRPYQVALAQAEGQLAKDQAALKNAQVDLQRYRTLVAQNSIARQTLDTQAALVQQDAGVIQTDQALIDAQKLNLTYCRIVAPVGGRVGLRQIDPGNYVQTSDASGIVVITQIQPISVIFTLPEDSLQAVLKQIRGGAKLQVTAFDRTGATKLDSGRLETVDNQIDPTTGTVKLRAAFDNATEALFPQQFVNIQLLVNTLHDTAIIPTAAVQRGAPGTFVYLVKPDNTVAAQPVTLGPAQGDTVSVSKGLEPGQQVVTDGADRLKDGAKVTLTEKTAPAGGSAPAGAPIEQAPQNTPAGESATAAPGAQTRPAAGQGQGQHQGQRRRSAE
jgi:membrane fusion protein, multidrug efflux system